MDVCAPATTGAFNNRTDCVCACVRARMTRRAVVVVRRRRRTQNVLRHDGRPLLAGATTNKPAGRRRSLKQKDGAHSKSRYRRRSFLHVRHDAEPESKRRRPTNGIDAFGRPTNTRRCASIARGTNRRRFARGVWGILFLVNPFGGVL